MHKIRVRGPAIVFDHRVDSDDPPEVTDPAILATLDGLRHDEVFADYIADGGDKTLAYAGVSGGLLCFEFDPKLKKLFAVTEYSAPRPLTETELGLLKEYTIGQWSDGIGSNFSQNRIDEGLAPQMLYFNDEVVTIEQRS